MENSPDTIYIKKNRYQNRKNLFYIEMFYLQFHPSFPQLTDIFNIPTKATLQNRIVTPAF